MTSRKTLADLRTVDSDYALDEWVYLRGEVEFEHFGARIGVPQKTWDQWYVRAERRGDPRAAGRVVPDFAGAGARDGTLRLPGRR